MNLNKENMRKIKELILFTVILLIALWNYELLFSWAKFAFGIIFPFLLGGGIAFVVNVPMSFLERKIFGKRKPGGKAAGSKISRPFSLVLTLVIVFGIVILVMFVVIPELTKTILSLGKTIQAFLPEAQRFLENLFRDNSEIRVLIASLDLDAGKIMGSAMEFLQNGASDVVGSTFSALGSIVSGVTTFVIAFVFACYVLLQKEKLHIQVKKILYAFMSEKRVEWCLEICSLTAKSFSNFLTGQCVEALILGFMFFVVMCVIYMPYALLVGVLIAFTALIPIFGAFIGCVVGAFLLLMVNPMKALAFIVVFLILQQIEGNLIYPKVVGSSVGLPSIWVLAAVTIGGSLMGIVGMLIFIPITSVVYNLFRASVYKRLRRKHRLQEAAENGTGEEKEEMPDETT